MTERKRQMLEELINFLYRKGLSGRDSALALAGAAYGWDKMNSLEYEFSPDDAFRDAVIDVQNLMNMESDNG